MDHFRGTQLYQQCFIHANTFKCIAYVWTGDTGTYSPAQQRNSPVNYANLLRETGAANEGGIAVESPKHFAYVVQVVCFDAAV